MQHATAAVSRSPERRGPNCAQVILGRDFGAQRMTKAEQGIPSQRNSMYEGRERKVHICLEMRSSLLWLEHRVWEKGREWEPKSVKRGWGEVRKHLLYPLKETVKF